MLGATGSTECTGATGSTECTGATGGTECTGDTWANRTTRATEFTGASQSHQPYQANYHKEHQPKNEQQWEYKKEEKGLNQIFIENYKF